MRFVIKPDSSKTNKLNSVSTYNKLKELCLTKNKKLIEDGIYRDSFDTEDGKQSHVFNKLAISYLYKCAYCEKQTGKGDIEHYRPKNAVAEDKNHDGYYWLSYEWSNLLPSCIYCNREGGKQTQFPIMGKRVSNHYNLKNGELDLDSFKATTSPLIDETPYLLHPEIDNPEDYFSFKIDLNNKGIRIKGIDKKGRGKKTIAICKLNRQELLLDRKKSVIDELKSALRSAFGKYIKSNNQDQLNYDLNNILDALIHKGNDCDNTHTLLRKYIVKDITNFNQIIVPFLDSLWEEDVVRAFESFFTPSESGPPTP